MEPNAEPTNIKIRLDLVYSGTASAAQQSYLSHLMEQFIAVIQTYTIYEKESGISWKKRLSWTENSESAVYMGIAQHVTQK